MTSWVKLTLGCSFMYYAISRYFGVLYTTVHEQKNALGQKIWTDVRYQPKRFKTFNSIVIILITITGIILLYFMKQIMRCIFDLIGYLTITTYWSEIIPSEGMRSRCNVRITFVYTFPNVLDFGSMRVRNTKLSGERHLVWYWGL